MVLPARLTQVPNFRQSDSNLYHTILDILIISVLAVLSGADEFMEIAVFDEFKLPVLRRHLALKNGLSSYDTLWRVFQHLDVVRFNHAFLGWGRQLLAAISCRGRAGVCGR